MTSLRISGGHIISGNLANTDPVTRLLVERLMQKYQESVILVLFSQVMVITC